MNIWSDKVLIRFTNSHFTRSSRNHLLKGKGRKQINKLQSVELYLLFVPLGAIPLAQEQRRKNLTTSLTSRLDSSNTKIGSLGM